MPTSLGAMLLSMETVAGAPFSLQADLPSSLMSRCTSREPSSSLGTDIPSKIAKTSSDSPVNMAETDADDSPVRTSSLEVRSPNTAWRASIIMDLPAPVSPVSTVKPGSKSMEALSITAILFINSSESTCESLLFLCF